MGVTIKRIGSFLGGCIAGAIAGIGTAIPVPVLGGAMMTGAFPVITALVFGAYTAYAIWTELKGKTIVRMVPTSWELQVI